MARPWLATAIRGGVRQSLGYYQTEEQARQAYLDFKAQLAEDVLEDAPPANYKIEPGKKPINLRFGTDWKRQ